PVSLGRATAAVGGALAAAGVVLLAGDRWAETGGTGLAILLTLALLVASVVAMIRPELPASVQVAAVAASGLAAPALAFFVTSDPVPSLRDLAIVSGMLLSVLYFVGPWRGHTFHLTILATAGWLFAISLADVDAGPSFGGAFETLSDVITEAGVASMLLGAAYLGVGRWLHASGLEGLATPFLGVGCLALPLGTFVTVRDSSELAGGLVALAVGAFVALVGGRSARRGTTWIGVAVGAAGVLGVAEGLSPDRAAVAGILLAAAGAGVVFAAPWAAAAAGEAPPAGPERVDGPPPGPGAGFYREPPEPPPGPGAGSFRPRPEPPPPDVPPTVETPVASDDPVTADLPVVPGPDEPRLPGDEPPPRTRVRRLRPPAPAAGD
ncbi:MAG: hypothetical protein ACRD0N_14445, partial [Acidimicrobiales bacterium]